MSKKLIQVGHDGQHGKDHPEPVQPRKPHGRAAADQHRRRRQKMGDRQGIDEGEQEDDVVECVQGGPLNHSRLRLLSIRLYHRE